MFSIDKNNVFPIGLTALISLTACGSERDTRPSAEDRAALRPMAQSAFDSSEHPDLAELSAVVAGFFLPDNRLALVERSEIHMIDLSSGEARVIGREGEGPREFRHIWPAKRIPGGILVSDVPRRRVSLISHDGEFLRSQSVLDAEFQDFFNAHPVGVHPDGRIIFRDGIHRTIRQYDGRTWNPATYVTVRDDGELEIFAQAKGKEVYYGSRRSGDVVFGHGTFEAATRDHLVIAETDRGAIALLDWSGREVAQIPMPAGVRLSDSREVGRQLLVSRWEKYVERLKRAAEVRSDSIGFGIEESPASVRFRGLPITNAPPTHPSDRLDRRLWRDYRLPDQDSVTWRVWDIDQQELLFIARMDGDDILLDARDDFVLLRQLDEFDVPRAVVTRLRALHDGG